MSGCGVGMRWVEGYPMVQIRFSAEEGEGRKGVECGGDGAQLVDQAQEGARSKHLSAPYPNLLPGSDTPTWLNLCQHYHWGRSKLTHFRLLRLIQAQGHKRPLTLRISPATKMPCRLQSSLCWCHCIIAWSFG